MECPIITTPSPQQRKMIGVIDRCRKCNRKIFWEKTLEHTTILLDAEAPVYTIIDHYGGPRAVSNDRTFVSHAAICPKAHDSSRPKRKEVL